MPLREIRDRFTWSEVVLMGWRSQEQAQQLKTKVPQNAKSAPPVSTRYMPGEIPEGLPERFFNEEGEVDLRQVSGRDAVRYLATIGIKVPVGGGVSRG